MNPQQQKRMRDQEQRIATLEWALREIICQCEDADEGLEMETIKEIDRVSRNALWPEHKP